MELATGEVERLTENFEVGESGAQFSPDGQWIAFSAPDEMDGYTMTENRVYLRAVADRGGDFRKLGSDFDQSVSIGFWSEDSKTIYFNTGVTVTNQLHALDIEKDEVRQVTKERASLSVNRDEDTGTLLINYQDPATPPTVFTVGRIDDVDDRSRWTQLVDLNPQIDDIALGREVEVNWTSTDGNTVGGILVYPVGYQEGTRYPLIVAIHGGPASADVLRFNGGYSAQVYAGAGYAVLKPNYRGSRNYGNAHRTDIVGDYFTLGFDDIMTGVDHLIAEGIVDEDRMGALGWSAGGHWSNWILTHTDRFKAISSGAGTMNWISMYAQSDVQRNRQFYVGDGFLYEDFDTYFDQSPLKYMTNAATPTMIHVVEGDPRVPSPQSVELHMALKKLEVPTELFMYPGRSHGIPDPRNRLVKAVSEMAWMDHYVRGVSDTFEWEQVLATLQEAAEDTPPVSDR
jgi:dipeptidyl aminopeptidase/acylaminoacyl peptidase